MKIFTVHTNPNAKDVTESASFVPEGFNWFAIIFPLNVFWAINNRCWLFLIAVIFYAFSNIIGRDILGMSMGSIVTVKLVLLPFFGFWANDLWRRSLNRRGFQLVSIVSGKDVTEAQRRWLEGSR
jgi:hypothetical protein